MTRYTIEKIAKKLYRDSWQNSNGYHDIDYDEKKDKITLGWYHHNSWDSDRSQLVGVMSGYITPSKCMEKAKEIFPTIQKERELFLKFQEQKN